LWGFERELDVSVYDDNRFGWDSDGTLIATMKLSRLIVDNGYTPQFAARIIDHADEQQQVIPQWLHHLDLLASYRLPSVERSRMTLSTATRLWAAFPATNSYDLLWRVSSLLV
jgi:hypothetical protein